MPSYHNGKAGGKMRWPETEKKNGAAWMGV